MTTTKKIEILTRVEGHGSLHFIRQNKQIVDAHLQLHESPRLFESLLIGRSYAEVPDIICRICSICSTVHKVAALIATEHALAMPVSRQTNLLRQLAVQGGQIESHALHIFCLALPDYLGVHGFPDLARVAPHELKLGLKIKKFGNLLQTLVGGRSIHPFNLIIGGMGRAPEVKQLQSAEEELTKLHDDIESIIDYVSALEPILPDLPPLPGCAVTGGPPLFGTAITTTTAGYVTADKVVTWLNEHVEHGTNAKVSHFDGKVPFMVGPLARRAIYKNSTVANINNSLLSRVVELQQAVAWSRELIGTLISEGIVNDTRQTIEPRQGEGIAIIEAPRGTLVHHYCFDEQGICTAANIITPTAINQAAIKSSLTSLITQMQDRTEAQITVAAERLIRCFDPCISCAVH